METATPMASARGSTRTGANILAGAEARLARAGVDSARLDAELLLARALGTSRAGALARLRDPMTEEVALRFRDLMTRRLRREPLAYILGEKEFWSLSLQVTRDTLIPRPETELLVRLALAHLPPCPSALLDVGTGSGCIALAVARERPDVAITAIDVSAPALAIARLNAERLRLAGRVRFARADLHTVAFRRRFDVVVSNPPYIRRGDLDLLEPEVAVWEPRLALAGGADGLECIAAVATGCRHWLQPGGWLALEIGSDQAEPAARRIAALGFERIEVRSDDAGLPRAILARLPESPAQATPGR